MGSTRGGQRIDSVADLDADHKRVSAIEKLRKARGCIDPHDGITGAGGKAGALESTPCRSMSTGM